MAAIDSPQGNTGPQVHASRRAVLGALTGASLELVAVAVATASSGAAARPRLQLREEPILLRRTAEGRRLSRFRYHNGESFFETVENGMVRCRSHQLYQVGITLQLGLSSHLLDVGFDDAWCARNIGLHVAKSLAYANATGLDHKCAELKRLAEILSPYSEWRNADVKGLPRRCPFSGQHVCRLTRALLERVHQVTGHPRPRGWRQQAR